MDAYVAMIRKLENKFYGLEIHHVQRADNQAADALSKLGSTRAEIPHGVFVEDLLKPSIEEEDKLEVDKPPVDQSVASISIQGNDWREPFIRYLTSADVPRDKVETESLIRRSKQYVLVDGQLMRKNASGELLQKCVSQEEGLKILHKIHAGTCGNHVASRTLVGKAFRAGFYWPSVVTDAEKLVRHCEGCQLFAKPIHVPSYELQTIPAS
jgi:hypothetical protein